MGPKKARGKNRAENNRVMSIELKCEIIEKREHGMQVMDLERQHKCSTSTICTILKHKELIKAIMPTKGVQIISKIWTSVLDKMENLLLVWLTEKQLAGDTVMEAIVCEKAKAIYTDLLQQIPTGPV
ncbi:putative CENPB DNA-binding domain-containing protein 1 [Oratosquilla oratoria]|uniref:putative CENPB DNA-binding domain-containing protein 1 n=1 Tax=Oratosquilla oratoria TaxID=337810 RepID=UPI003F7698E5